MRKNLTTKTILILAVLVVFIFGIFGIPKGISPKAWKDALTQKIHLGLDLRGGTHLVLQVQVQEAVSAATDNDAARIQTDLQSNNVAATSVLPDPQHPDTIQIAGTPPDRAGDIRTLLNNKYSTQYDVKSGANNTWTLTLKPSVVQQMETSALEHSIDTIRTRIDTLGVSEPVIQEYNLGNNQILVELPGVDDLARVHEIIQSTARLEIHQVLGGPYPTDEAATQALGGSVPYDAVLVHEMAGTAGTNSPDQVYELKKVPEVAGTDIRDAQTNTNPNTNEPQVVFYLTRAAGDHFAEFTGANIGKSLAVVSEQQVQEVANIKGQIRDEGTISGGAMGEQQAKDLSMLLRTGALPASIHYLQESTIGPSLGADSIRQGVLASDRRHDRGDGVHAGLLSRRGHQRGSRSVSQPGHPAGIHGLYRIDVDAAWNRGRDPHHRYGRRFQRADL